MTEPSASNFPTSLDNTTSLGGDAVNLTSLTLDAGIDASTQTISVTEDITGVNVPCYILCGSELMWATAKSSGNFTSVDRGAGGTSATTHNNGDAVYVVYAANQFNQLKRAIIATQTALGISSASAIQTGKLDFPTSSELTISSGSITPTQNWHTVDTESDAASDDLDTIATTNVTDGFILILRINNSARSVVIKHNTGNILTDTSQAVILGMTNRMCSLMYDGSLSKWLVMSAGSSTQALIGRKRLSLTTSVPITTTDVTAATTVYWTDGDVNLSVAVPSTTNTPFDVFYSLSGNTLSTTNWTNTTTRATGLAYNENGMYVKSGDKDKLYLGTGCTTGVSGQCEDSAAKRLLWNMYNRLERSLNVYEATNSWNYTTATWRSANGSDANRVAFVQGLDENRIVAEVAGSSSNSSTGTYGLVGLALDATNTNDCATDGVTYLSTVGAADQVQPTYGRYSKHVGIGYHYLQWTESSNGTGTQTFYGKNSTVRQSGIVGRVIG